MKIIGALAAASTAVLAVLAGCSSEDAESAETFDIAAQRQPVITSVTTDDGFTQVRQDATATLVIKGKRLQHTTGVTVGDLTVVGIDSVTAREVRVTVSTTSAMTLGPADVTVTSANDTTVATGAITLTPFVVSPTGAGGHGTFQSPMGLCDAELELFSDALSTIVLLPGTHRCGRTLFLQFGSFAGDPAQPTIVTGTDEGGFGIAAFAFGRPSTIRDLTFAPPLAASSIESDGSELHVERVVDAGGVVGADGSLLKLDQYTYEGEGDGIDTFIAEITNSTIRHCGSGTGIVARTGNNGGGITIDHTVVEDCNVGVAFLGPGNFGRVGGKISSSQLLDNGVGIFASFAIIEVSSTVIAGNDATPRVSSRGISAGSGFASLSDIEITGQQDAGLSVSHSQSDGEDAVVSANGLHITGGRVGIAFNGIDNNLSVHNSIIRDQTVASVAISSLDGSIDIGGNQLSVISGFAIDDSRFTESGFSHFMHAEGTTLNGVSFDGQSIDGPAELAPYYRIAFDSGIQF